MADIRHERLVMANRQTARDKDSPNKHQAKTAEMRRKLLKSARKIFARSGFEAARLEDIAKDAGHTRGAFYAHFSCKEDLFFALLEEEIKKQRLKVETLLESQPSREGKLRVLRDYYVDRLTDPTWSMLILEFKLFAVRHPKLRARLASAYRAMRASIQSRTLSDLIGGGPLCSDSAFHVTKIVLDTFLQSLALQHVYDPITLSAVEARSALGRVFDNLFGEG